MVTGLRAFAHNAACAVVILGAWAFFLLILRHVDYAHIPQPPPRTVTFDHLLATKAINKYVKEHSE